MKRTIIIGFVAALLALSAAQVLALQTGTWTCMGYTITVTPDDPDNPSLAGSVVIVKSDDYADVDVSGRYWKEDGRRPATIVDIKGTITTQGDPIPVAQQFTFQPGPQNSIWRTVITWLENRIVE